MKVNDCVLNELYLLFLVRPLMTHSHVLRQKHRTNRALVFVGESLITVQVPWYFWSYCTECAKSSSMQMKTIQRGLTNDFINLISFRIYKESLLSNNHKYKPDIWNFRNLLILNSFRGEICWEMRTAIFSTECTLFKFHNT